ncbi:MAG: sigma-54-dependent transcriptional regulator [Acidobacteriota bacterium]
MPSRSKQTVSDTARRGRILVVDDEPSQVTLVSDILAPEGHAVDTALSGEAALKHLRDTEVDLVIADLMMPGMDGFELLKNVGASWPEVPVIFLTGRAEVDSAVAAIKDGAENYVTKPLDIDRFRLAVSRALERKALRDDNARLRRMVWDRRGSFGALIGASDLMQSVYDDIQKVGPTGTSVLILGESGTGKEVTAREIHRHSTRAGAAFLAINCAALPANLLESELFGHVKGAFTGAVGSKVGLFEAASGGTIFLDEIGATDEAIQRSLLRVLQEREVRRVGDTAPRSIDVRVISATNADPQAEMEQGTLRSDLYFRLSGVVIRLPPLRDRHGDVGLLAENCLAQACRRQGKKPMAISPRALERLERYAWPGNVRELENIIERAAIYGSRQRIGPKDLDLPAEGAAAAGADETLALDRVVQTHLEATLARCRGNKAQAARLLGIPRTSLYKRLKKYGIE